MSSPADESTESPTQKQARLRRERRDAKIKAGGSARLDKITSLSGRPTGFEAPPPLGFQATAAHNPSDDPAEIDISQHFPANRDGGGAPTEAQLRQMMAGFDPSAPQQQRNPFLGPQQQQGQNPNEDPIMKMMQMLGGGVAGEKGQEGLPPALAAMLGGNAGMDQAPQQQEDRYGYLWRIVHALFALALGVYIASVTSFSGSYASRSKSSVPSVGEEVGVQFFWVFATAELVLQSSRFLIEKGRPPQGGILAGLSMMLPEPYAGYMKVWGRYSVIYTTVVADAMVVVFVLGMVAWWRGEMS
ncbi:MAG: hypothetical protein M1835_007867 [Candelina submexicana]|nr:MAG: hypothetical protein M1835_007867 [Candelina submexicana]